MWHISYYEYNRLRYFIHRIIHCLLYSEIPIIVGVLIDNDIIVKVLIDYDILVRVLIDYDIIVRGLVDYDIIARVLINYDWCMINIFIKWLWIFLILIGLEGSLLPLTELHVHRAILKILLQKIES